MCCYQQIYRAAGALPQTAEDTIGRNPSVRSSTTITMLSRARFRAVAHIRSFLYSKFVMTLVHLKIEKYRIERTRPIYRSDLVLTEWTDSQSRLTK